jgi:hypothetical protein
MQERGELMKGTSKALHDQIILRPCTGSFQMAVRTVSPRQALSRGRPTFTESSRGIQAHLPCLVQTPKVLLSPSTQPTRVQVA